MPPPSASRSSPPTPRPGLWLTGTGAGEPGARAPYPPPLRPRSQPRPPGPASGPAPPGGTGGRDAVACQPAYVSVRRWAQASTGVSRLLRLLLPLPSHLPAACVAQAPQLRTQLWGPSCGKPPLAAPRPPPWPQGWGCPSAPERLLPLHVLLAGCPVCASISPGRASWGSLSPGLAQRRAPQNASMYW